jgi:RNA polymerase sigma-70 factor, ECF subfamily
VRERGLVTDDREPAGRAPADSTNRERAFAVLADSHLSRAYRLAAVLLGSPLEAEDAVQDAAVAAWRSFHSLRDVDRFDAWFDRILVNGCRDRLRKRGHVRLIPMEATREPSTTDRAGAVLERDALLVALAALPPQQRLVVVLRYFEDLSVEEIAQRTGERSGTVKSRLHYGLAALRAAYDAAARAAEA